MDSRITGDNGDDLGSEFPVFWNGIVPVPNSNEVPPSDIPEMNEKSPSKANLAKEERKISKCVIGDFFDKSHK